MLDSETEPCLMMESVLTETTRSNGTNCGRALDASIAEEDDDDDVLLEDDEDNSLNNLSQAISNRQQIELQTSQMLSSVNFKSFRMLKQQQQSSSLEQEEVSHTSDDGGVSLMRCETCTGNTQAIIEQVICVDNLITKLLKVMRIVQLDNDNCIQRLIAEK